VQAATSALAPSKWEFAGLDCLLCESNGRDGDEKPLVGRYDLVIICLHGVGAPPSDFIPLCDSMRSLPINILWVFPAAPKKVIPGPLNPPTWFKADLIKLATLLARGEEGYEKLLQEPPKGLEKMRSTLGDLLHDVCRYAEVPMNQIILGGFSMGAIAAMDAALARTPLEELSCYQHELGGVIMMSGAPIVAAEWKKCLELHQGIRVLVIHGTADKVLPYKGSQRCRDILLAGGALVEHITHNLGHEFGPAHIFYAIADFIRQTAYLSGVPRILLHRNFDV